MNWKEIKTASEYKKAIERTVEIFHAAKGSSEADELELLLVLVKDYEDKHIPLPESDLKKQQKQNIIDIMNLDEEAGLYDSAG
jgi:hypothetical protein